ncbi:pyridine nucleotide-disulfide oxidoreductase family protein [Mycobacterium xenopi 4042]|uniref:Pyridine nucleotide-disulfide oxidoreductase family protein n=1 Tax=Mycobacterium xenopi 4042 TaxID=1299334 RepID=X8BGD9_MYCXE|nr:pyridine nucleotide-disulfide oxidoreductase family protein [Mycobacterium xenopi 4042]
MCGCRRWIRPTTPSGCRMTPPSATTSCCWPPGHVRGASRYRDPTLAVCTICGHSTTARPGFCSVRGDFVGGCWRRWIGLEVAASARQRGVNVTVVETAKQPLMAALGEEVGEVFAALHRDHGVDLRLQAQVDEISTTDGVATGLLLRDGSTVSADAVLVAVGAQPNVELAEQAGLSTGDGGVLVDASLRTSDPTFTQSATSPPPSIRCSAPGSAPSTGPMRSNNQRWRRPACWARRLNTPSCRTFSPTSTTWAWSMSATRPTMSGWFSAAMWPAANLSPSGSTTAGGCWPG